MNNFERELRQILEKRENYKRPVAEANYWYERALDIRRSIFRDLDERLTPLMKVLGKVTWNNSIAEDKATNIGEILYHMGMTNESSEMYGFTKYRWRVAPDQGRDPNRPYYKSFYQAILYFEDGNFPTDPAPFRVRISPKLDLGLNLKPPFTDEKLKNGIKIMLESGPQKVSTLYGVRFPGGSERGG